MSILTRIGLGALVALAVAMVPAASALGANAKTVYAENAEVGHKLGDPYVGPTNGAMSSANAKFKTATGTISCTESTMNGTITDSGAGDGVVNGVIEVNTFTKGGGACPSTFFGSPNCAITANNLGWNFTITSPLTTILLTISNPQLTINCGGGNCVYGAAAIVGTVSWNPAGFSFNSSVKNTEGMFCPETGTLEVVYSVTGEDDLGGETNIQVWTF